MYTRSDVRPSRGTRDMKSLSRNFAAPVVATQAGTRPDTAPQPVKKSGNGVSMKQLGSSEPTSTRAPAPPAAPSRPSNGSSNGLSTSNGSSNGLSSANGSRPSRGTPNGTVPSSSRPSAGMPSSRPSSGSGPSPASRSLVRSPASARPVTAEVLPPSPSSSSAASESPSPLTRTQRGLLSPTAPLDLSNRPGEADYKWAQESYSSLQRTVDTWTFFTVFRSQLWLLDQKWSYVGGFSEDKKKERTRRLARYMLESILNLGPTFIKIGQLSSTRSDIFPAEFIEELSELQDRVPAFSADKAVAIIEKELGQPISRLFKSFERRPIAAASLGQVHRAVLWSGEEVVVKVQRPGLKQLFDIDLNNLRVLAEQLDKQEEGRDFKGIYQECAQVLYQEIDYINEGRNSDKFRRNFKDVPYVRVPIVYWEYSSTRVLTLQYLPGVKITDKERLTAAGIELDTVAQRATEAYLIQILRHGFYHADPHPGNVSVDVSDGPTRGSLLYYDFGMMGDIVPNVREKLLDVFYGIYKKDSSQVIRSLTELGVIKPTGDMLTLKRSINYFIENLARQTERQETISAIGEDLFAIAVDQPFRFPATFTFVLRAFSTLEGIGKTLNPNYKFSEVAQPYAQELLDLQNSQTRQALLINQVQQQASELTAAAAAMPFRIARIDSLLEQLEGGDVKLRVRALEVERAARKMGVMQAATMNTIGAVGFLNVGTMLALNDLGGPATAALGLSALFGVLMLQGFKRIQRLEQFEKEIKGM